MPMNHDALMNRIREEYVLDWHGIHGVDHWARVRENGLRLAESTGANVEIIEYFALLHDARRQDDGRDLDHGPRAAELVRELAGGLVDLPEPEVELLYVACRDHTRGFVEGDLTVLTCWDADRLDIGRVGIRPDPRFLGTEAARDPETIAWGWRRSRQGRTG